MLTSCIHMNLYMICWMKFVSVCFTTFIANTNSNILMFMSIRACLRWNKEGASDGPKMLPKTV